MTTDTDAGPAFRGAAKRLIEAHNENAMLHLRLHLALSKKGDAREIERLERANAELRSQVEAAELEARR